jgi:phosphoglycolate phosphatase
MKVIILDFDGVLVDSLDSHVGFYRDKAREHGFDTGLVPSDCRQHSHVVDQIIIQTGFSPELIQDIMNKHYHEFDDSYPLELFPGAERMVTNFNGIDDVRLVIVSSNTLENVQRGLGGLFDLFDMVFTKEDMNGDMTKAEGISLAVMTFGARVGDAIYIGDMNSDRLAAEEAGVIFIGVSYGWQINDTNILDIPTLELEIKRALML